MIWYTTLALKPETRLALLSWAVLRHALLEVRGMTWNELGGAPVYRVRDYHKLFRSGECRTVVSGTVIFIYSSLHQESVIRACLSHSVRRSSEDCDHETSQSCCSSRFISLSKAELPSDYPSSLPLYAEDSSDWATDWKIASLRPSSALEGRKSSWCSEPESVDTSVELWVLSAMLSLEVSKESSDLFVSSRLPFGANLLSASAISCKILIVATCDW